ncbi:hypothetical protein FRX31_027328 [Thalictrum thalictroides]|uniref:Uncharacterized protein n=1 Tax=Thalictrum thalictroides TaxID=46969 RepID=A0A7J6VD99_THATH|nr:hypothetical protein FRX31_027328 [Thalictrum thalictroides]
MGARYRVLHRNMVSTVFCKSSSIVEMPREEAYWLWRAMMGDRLDILLLIWTQMVNTFNEPVNKCLPFGALIKELVPTGFFEEDTPMMDALEAIGHKVFRAMRLTRRRFLHLWEESRTSWQLKFQEWPLSKRL